MAPGAVGADRLPIEGSMNQAFGNLLCSVPGGRAAAACPAPIILSAELRLSYP